MTKPVQERDLATRFLDAYNHLDRYMRTRLEEERQGVGHVQLIKRLVQVDPVFRNRQAELEQLAHLRNAIIHSPREPDGTPIAEPNEDVVRRYEELVSQVLRPALAKEFAVPAERIFTAKWTDRLHAVVTEMNRCVYTHVPILEESRIIGVFSENTLFCALAGKAAVDVNDETQVSEFREFAPVSKHISECFEFVAPDTTLESVAELFAERLKLQQRLGAVFLTDDGTEAGRLLGLMTAWDAAGANLPLPKLTRHPIPEPSSSPPLPSSPPPRTPPIA